MDASAKIKTANEQVRINAAKGCVAQIKEYLEKFSLDDIVEGPKHTSLTREICSLARQLDETLTSPHFAVHEVRKQS